MKQNNRLWWELAGVAVAYAVIARLGLLLAYTGTNATAVWFPSGLALGCLLRWGTRLWPGIAVGALAANFCLFLDLNWSVFPAMTASVFTSAGNTLEALAGAWLIRRFASSSNPFSHSHDVFIFVSCGALAASAISATLGMTTFCVSTGQWATAEAMWRTWWLGDVVGILVVTPLILTWQPFDFSAVKKRHAAETMLLALGVIAVSWVVFTYEHPLNFLLVLIVLVGVFRLGQFGSAAVVFVLCVVFNLEIAHHTAGDATHEALLLNQGFVAVVAIATRVLAAILHERTVATEQLRVSEQQIRSIMENLADPVAVLDREGRRLYNSPACVAILGAPEKLQDALYFSSVHKDDEARVRDIFQETVRTGVGKRMEYRLVDKNGDPRYVESHGSVIRDATGQVAQVVMLSRDVTKRHRAEEEVRRLHSELQRHAEELEHRVSERTGELQNTQSALMNLVEDLNEKTRELAVAVDRAEAADRLKSAFLATRSHELRTPLNSIIGFTGIILQGLAGPLNPEQGKQLEMVRNSARHLLALINDVLDISKIEAGQLEVTFKQFDLRGSIERAADLVKPMAMKKGLALHVELAPEINTWVSDQRRVEQILINLLNNAIKFTDRGEVHVAGGIESGALKIAVRDTGIGIKAEDLDKLFLPFRQIDSGLARNHEGTGLGLAICRKLAELLGGQIMAQSDWGKGSTFTIVLQPKQGA